MQAPHLEVENAKLLSCQIFTHKMQRTDTYKLAYVTTDIHDSQVNDAHCFKTRIHTYGASNCEWHSTKLKHHGANSFFEAGSRSAASLFYETRRFITVLTKARHRNHPMHFLTLLL
jgi:hypothetical protein